jgi:hypothetical protein
MTDTHDAVEFMERMIDEIGLTRDTPPAAQDEMLAQLHAEAARTFRDPDLLDAALQFLDHWRDPR